MLLLSRVGRLFIKRKKQVHFFVLLLTTQVLFSAIFFDSAYSRTWYIKPDRTGDAPTIQAGVNSAAVGDTVLVGAGTYSDTTHVSIEGTIRAVNVYIQKQITLIGESSTEHPLIDGVNSYVGIFVENVDSTVSIGHLKLQ